MADSGLMAWHRQPSEGEAPYEAFMVYLKLGPERTFEKAAAQLGKSKSLMSAWSQKFKWRERIRLYDNMLQLERDKNQQKIIKKAIISFQGELLRDEAEDYRKLLEKWRNQVDNADALELKDFNTLVRTRMLIDEMGRRLAELPMTHMERHGSPKASDDDGDGQAMVIEWKDNPEGASALPELPIGGEEENGEDSDDEAADTATVTW